MKAGDLTERVTVERAVTTDDGAGGQTVDWQPVPPNLWAKVRPVKGRETEDMGRRATVETYLIVIRYGPSVTTLDRLVWSGKQLNIRAAQDRDGDRRWLTLECEAGLGT